MIGPAGGPAEAGPEVSYRMIVHAAHYMGQAGGHDVEEFSYLQPERLPVPAGVPADTEYHRGFRSPVGVQGWVYSRCVPWSVPTCPRCEK